MTLLEYVVLNAEEIPAIKIVANTWQQTLEEAILDGYCPSYFKIL